MAMDDERRAQGTSFGARATDYDRFRPEPPDAALDWLLAPDVHRVAEIGAGTGLLTRGLVRRGLDVVAIEPDPRMRTVLEARVPGARVEDGRGEQVPLPDGSVDAVLAASSWHWVEQSQGFAEAARVLRPQGTLGLMWTGPDRRVPWVRLLMAGGSTLSEEEQAGRDKERSRRHRPEMPDGAPFSAPDIATFVTTTRATLDDLVGLRGTYSEAIATSGRNREAFLRDTKEYAAGHLEFENGTVALPIGCVAWRATRR